MKSPSGLLRVASGMSVLLFAGHTAGGVHSWSPQGENPVLGAMKAVQFQVSGFTRTFWDFYVGFGFVISVYLLAQAIMLWQLATAVKAGTIDPVRAQPFVLVFFLTAVATVILDWMFFFTAPIVLSMAIAACLGLAVVSTMRAGVAQPVSQT
jgi:hypothetical protein